MALLRPVLVPPSADTQLPHPRSGHRVVVDNVSGNMYVLGGYNPDVVTDDTDDPRELEKRIFVQLWRFNIFSRRWKELRMLGDRPRCLASHTASLHGQTLLTFGGSGIPFGIVSSHDVHKCRLDPHADHVEWSILKASGDMPESKYGHCQVVIGNYFYVIGGTTGFIYNTDVHRLDLTTGTWKCLYDCPRQGHDEEGDIHNPVGRYRHEVVVHNNRILMIGGGQARRAFRLDKIPYFDLETDCWERLQTLPNIYGQSQQLQLPDIPPPRRCHSCVKHQNNLYVLGGRNEEAILGDLWRLNLDTRQWSCMVFSIVSPVKGFFHDADVTDSGCMYVFGGVVNADVEARTNLVHKVWLLVPSLKELAWTLVSDVLHADRSPALASRLLLAGAPRELTQRLPQS